MEESKTVSKTITEVLAEIKVLNQRIPKKISESIFVSVGFANPTEISKTEQNKRKQDILSQYQSVTDLIKRRSALKAILVQVNAENMITVAGQTMSVASAVEMKTSISFYEDILSKLTVQLVTANREKNLLNGNLEKDLDSLRKSFSGSAQPLTSSAIQEQIDARRRESERVLIDPLDIQSKIDELNSFIETFKSEVDTTLSIFNATTKVEVPM